MQLQNYKLVYFSNCAILTLNITIRRYYDNLTIFWQGQGNFNFLKSFPWLANRKPMAKKCQIFVIFLYRIFWILCSCDESLKLSLSLFLRLNFIIGLRSQDSHFLFNLKTWGDWRLSTDLQRKPLQKWWTDFLRNDSWILFKKDCFCFKCLTLIYFDYIVVIV